MEVYLIIAICILASIGLYALMRRNQDKDAMVHLQSYKEEIPLEDEIVGNVKVIPAEEYGSNKAPASNQAARPQKAKTSADNELLVLYVAAGNNGPFMGYELMQSLMAQGLQAGPMNIVHRYDEEGRIIFSVASATGEGTIDLTNMGDFVTSGLCLFIYPQKSIRPRHAFNEMVDCALQLAEELEGQVLDHQREPWTQAFEQSKRESLPVYQPQAVEG